MKVKQRIWDGKILLGIQLAAFFLILDAGLNLIVKGDVGSKTTCDSTNLFKMVQYKMFLFA